MFPSASTKKPVRGVQNIRHRHSERLMGYFTGTVIHRCPTYKASLKRPLDVENKSAKIKLEVRNWPPFKQGKRFHFNYPMSNYFFAVEDAIKIKKLLTARVEAGIISLPILPSDIEASASGNTETPSTIASEDFSGDSSCEDSSTSSIISETTQFDSSTSTDTELLSLSSPENDTNDEDSDSDTIPSPTPSALTGGGGRPEYFLGPDELNEMFASATEEPRLFRFNNMLWSVTKTTTYSDVTESITPPEIKVEDATSVDYSEDEPEDYSQETLALVPYVPMDILPPQDEPLDLSWTPPQDEPLDLSRTQPPELD